MKSGYGSSRILLAALILSAVPLLAQPDVATLEKPFQAFGKSFKSVNPPDDSTRGFDVTHYTLDLRIDPVAESLSGRVDIDLDLEAPAPARVLLDLISTLQVDSLYWDGSAAIWEHAGDSIWVEVPPAETDGLLSVFYQGHPQPESAINAGMLFRAYGSTRDNPDGLGKTVFTVSEPWSANSWWPCKDHLADKATATIALTVPDTMRAVANGTLESETPADPGWTRFVWQESYPVSTYLVGIAVANYLEWEESCALEAGLLPLTFHVYRTDEVAARFDLGRTCEMMAFLESLCGPYPFMSERYGQMEIKWGGGMEHQTSTSIGQTLLPGDRRQEQIILHELAHQWFGDLQTPAAWSDIWLNEGFASYFQALWLEYDQGREAFEERMYLFGPGNPGHPDLFADDGILTDPWPILPNIMIYHKGAWVLHMLRGVIGDAAFFSFLHDYISDPLRAYGAVTTDDMIAAAEAAAGRDLSAVLDPWLNTSAVPLIDWSLRVSDLDGERKRLDIRIEQKQATLFELHLPLRLLLADSEVDTMLVLATAIDSLSIEVDGPVLETQLDPDGWVLMHVEDTATAITAPTDSTTVAPTPSGRADLLAISLMPIRPNPSREQSLEVAFRLQRSGRISLNVYDVLGRRRDSQQWGAFSAREAPYSRIWRAVDRNGRALPAGCYWLEIKVDERRDVRKVTLLR